LTVLVLACSAAISPDTVLASEPHHTIGVGLGGVHQQVRDDVLAPLRWDGPGAAIELSYDNRSRAGRHHAEFRFPVAFVKNRYDAEGVTAEVTAGYGYLRTVAGDVAGGRIRVGGLLDWTLNLEWFEDWDDEHLYWLNAYELGPWVTWARPLGADQRIEIGLDVPIVALTSRVRGHHFYKLDPMDDVGFYFSEPHEDMGFTSLGEHFAVCLRCDYSSDPGHGWPVDASIIVDYKTNGEPERVRILTTTLLVRFTFHPGHRGEDGR
jgi:hypothetical protein